MMSNGFIGGRGHELRVDETRATSAHGAATTASTRTTIRPTFGTARAITQKCVSSML
jgi:hypothetical protein